MEPRFLGMARGRVLALFAVVLAMTAFPAGAARADEKNKEKEKSKSVGAFGESRRGDVPEGTLEMLNAETDKAIQNGLTWLARSQNADGSFGSGTYRGNIAVTSLAGLAFMSGGSTPGRGPYGGHIEKA